MAVGIKHDRICRAPHPASGVCRLEEGHGGPHADEHGVWEIASDQPAVLAQIADGRTLAAHEQELSNPAVFTREELTAAAAKQQRRAPTKAEILTAIAECPAGVTSAYRAVEKLFEERGL